MRQSWIEYVQRTQRLMAERKSGSDATITMTAHIDRGAAQVGMTSHQAEARHMIAFIIFLIDDLTDRRPDLAQAQEMKMHAERLLGGADLTRAPSEVN